MELVSTVKNIVELISIRLTSVLHYNVMKHRSFFQMGIVKTVQFTQEASLRFSVDQVLAHLWKSLKKMVHVKHAQITLVQRKINDHAHKFLNVEMISSLL